MTHLKSKKLAAIALSMCLATGAVAAIGYASNNGLDASAKTANYQVSEASIGYGEQNKATGIIVTAEEPATLTLKDVAAGQYYINMDVEVEGEDYPALMVTVDNSEPTYLTYNFYAGRYLAVVDVKADSVIVISTDTENTYTVDAYLGNLFIGPENDYNLPEINFVAGTPVTVDLAYVDAGNYFMLINFWASEPISEEVSFTVAIDGGEAIEVTRNEMYWNGFTAEFEIPEDAKTLTFNTNSEVALTHGNISLQKYVHVDPLPEGEITLNVYETVTYSFSVENSGYYAINYTNVDVKDALIAIAVKEDVESFDGTSIEGNDFPMYLEAYVTYYMDVTYMGTEDYENSPSQATVTLSIKDWEIPTLKAYGAGVYVPSTSAKNVQPFNLDVKNDTYTLALVNVPVLAYMYGVNVIAHFGFESVLLSPSNDYTAEVTLNGVTSMWLTNDYGENLVVKVVIGGDAETLKLGEETEITLSGTNQTALYAIELEAGEYSIEIVEGEPVIQVSVDGIVAIPVGEYFAEFTVKVIEDEETNTTSVILLFEYEGEEEVTFSVLVKKA